MSASSEVESAVVILFGGRSSERLVSVASAQNVSAHLPASHCWFIDPTGAVFVVPQSALAAHQRPFEVPFVASGPAAWPTLEAALDATRAKGYTTFLALHGGEGENGVTQRQFEVRRLAFTGSGSQASADAFDKARAKHLAGAKGARLAEAQLLEVMGETQGLGTLAALLQRHPRWVLKPRADGSSHGLMHLTQENVADCARRLAALGMPYLAEVFVAGRELTVGVIDSPTGPTALPVSEVRVAAGGAFDFAGKYLGRGTQEITPADLTQAERAAAQALAVLTHRAVGCFGYSRTDMILDAQGPVLLEVNTLPGMTKASFIPQQLAAAGIALTDFLEQQLNLARKRSTP
jgi:D-alanine-D-alanine ligase